MTFREKLAMDYPDADEDELRKMTYEDCPSQHGYEEPGHGCDESDGACSECWERQYKQWCSKKHEQSGGSHDALEIKDSGNRRQFETGAVRDIQEGKGRCDLMPLEVVACLIANEEEKCDSVIDGISFFMRTGDVGGLYKSLRTFGVKEYGRDGGICEMLIEVSKHFEAGAKKYGEHNWQMGIPIECYIDSAVRHYLKYMAGYSDEPHDRAFVWNIMCCIWEVKYHDYNN